MGMSASRTDLDVRHEPPDTRFFGQPAVLAKPFGVGVWEGFSFHGMQGILLIHLYYSAARGGWGIVMGLAFRMFLLVPSGKNSVPILGLALILLVLTIAEPLIPPVGLSLATEPAPRAFVTQTRSGRRCRASSPSTTTRPTRPRSSCGSDRSP
jgi:dipeptide/tripeptide permease